MYLPSSVFLVPEEPVSDELNITLARVYKRYPLVATYAVSMDASVHDLMNSENIEISVHIDNDPGTKVSRTIPVSQGSYDSGVFTYRGSDGISYLKLNFIDNYLFVVARNLYAHSSVTIEISCGQYLATGSTTQLSYR